MLHPCRGIGPEFRAGTAIQRNLAIGMLNSRDSIAFDQPGNVVHTLLTPARLNKDSSACPSQVTQTSMAKSEEPADARCATTASHSIVLENQETLASIPDSPSQTEVEMQLRVDMQTQNSPKEVGEEGEEEGEGMATVIGVNRPTTASGSTSAQPTSNSQIRRVEDTPTCKATQAIQRPEITKERRGIIQSPWAAFMTPATDRCRYIGTKAASSSPGNHGDNVSTVDTKARSPSPELVPFAMFSSPIVSQPTTVKRKTNDLRDPGPSTQEVLGADMQNPWLSSTFSEADGHAKRRKRVSFSALPLSPDVADERARWRHDRVGANDVLTTTARAIARSSLPPQQARSQRR